jgi:hypothetical protein
MGQACEGVKCCENVQHLAHSSAAKSTQSRFYTCKKYVQEVREHLPAVSLVFDKRVKACVLASVDDGLVEAPRGCNPADVWEDPSRCSHHLHEGTLRTCRATMMCASVRTCRATMMGASVRTCRATMMCASVRTCRATMMCASDRICEEARNVMFGSARREIIMYPFAVRAARFVGREQRKLF